MKCSVPYCINENTEPVKLKHVNGWPEVQLCNFHAERFKFIDDELDSLAQTRGFNETYFMFYIPIELLKQALLAFGMGLNEPSAIMARSALEAALFYRLIAKDLKFNNNGVLVSYTPDDQNINMLKDKKIGFQFLINCAKIGGLLNNNLTECANKVKNNGDHIAHLAEQFTRKLTEASKSSIKNNSSITNDLKIWLDNEEAKKNIDCAVEVMKHLIEETYKLASVAKT
ncbi:hypothetical protein [Acidianus manzaensis]|uniref:Uncharacterized protein n=1 Tax=Acidianus manzaensis TaxID=282676 RepID=A0A1W6K399_9CREN|nr:hypothetical protein [Acidianus manzaensis]ARM76955.1 hypothetical protein B6F84_13640 [Acidianus manzaensis]